MSCTLDQENALRKAGFEIIAGIDEAGRGPLAGPVVAAAVILPEDFEHEVLNDSKKLTGRKREILYEELTSDPSILISSNRGTVKEIDRINILKATHLAMKRASQALELKPDHVLIDGLAVKGFPVPQTPLVKGDSISFSIAAASIIAKVERDRLMLKMAKKYPEYGFERHKGYGTKLHMEALKKYGPCPIHRRSFAPVSQMMLDF